MWTYADRDLPHNSAWVIFTRNFYLVSSKSKCLPNTITQNTSHHCFTVHCCGIPGMGLDERQYGSKTWTAIFISCPHKDVKLRYICVAGYCTSVERWASVSKADGHLPLPKNFYIDLITTMTYVAANWFSREKTPTFSPSGTNWCSES